MFFIFLTGGWSGTFILSRYAAFEASPKPFEMLSREAALYPDVVQSFLFRSNVGS